MVLTGILVFASSGVCGAALQRNDSGDAVKELQRNLSSAGYYVEADGNYGPATESAVRRFQRQNHLTEDGVAGDATCEALARSMLMTDDNAEHTRQNSLSWHPNPQHSTEGWETNTFSGQTARAVTEEARKYIGIPYRFGGEDTSGFDCSGFIQYVFRKRGVKLPRSADQQYFFGEQVSQGALRPGDLVFFSTYEPGVSHSGIYIGNGNFISATTSRGVAIASLTSGYWLEHYVGAKRVL